MLEAVTPKEHKALGRKVKGFDDGIWNESRFWTDIVKLRVLADK